VLCVGDQRLEWKNGKWKEVPVTGERVQMKEKPNFIEFDRRGKLIPWTTAAISIACASLFLLVVPVSSLAQGSTRWTSRFDVAHSADKPVAMTTDAAGNVYVTGISCVDSLCADQEALTVKYNSSGNVLWKAWLSSSAKKASGRDIALDANGNVYVFFVSTSFQTGSSVPVSSAALAKYNPAGSRQWINFLVSGPPPPSGSADVNQKRPQRLAVSPQGNVYVQYSTFAGAFLSESDIAKYNTNGLLQWTRAERAVTGTFPISIGLDSLENVYSLSADTAGGIDPQSDYISAYDSTGKIISGGSANQIGKQTAFHVDAQGNSYTCGFSIQFTGVSGQPPRNLPEDGIVTKYNPSGSLAWLDDLDTVARDSRRMCPGITTDALGNIFVAQSVRSEVSSTGEDIAVIKFDASGHQLWQSRYNGQVDGSGVDHAAGLALNAAGEVFVLGQSDNAAGISEIVTIKYDGNGHQKWVQRYGGPAHNLDIPVAISVSGSNVVVTGTSGGLGTSVDWVVIDYED
jgi:hypothetical protein